MNSVIGMLMFAYGDEKNPPQQNINKIKQTLEQILKYLGNKVKNSNLIKNRLFNKKKHTIGHLFSIVFFKDFKNFKQFQKLYEFIDGNKYYNENQSEIDNQIFQENEINLKNLERQLFLSKRIDQMDENDYIFYTKCKETNFLKILTEFKDLIQIEKYNKILYKKDINIFLKFFNYVISKMIQQIIESTIKKKNQGFLEEEIHLDFKDIEEKCNLIQKIICYKIDQYIKKNKNYQQLSFNLFQQEFYIMQYDKLFQQNQNIQQCWEQISEQQQFWTDRIRGEKIFEKILKQQKINEIEQIENDYCNYLLKNYQIDQQNFNLKQLFKKYFLMRGKVEIQEQKQIQSKRLKSIFD